MGRVEKRIEGSARRVERNNGVREERKGRTVLDGSLETSVDLGVQDREES